MNPTHPNDPPRPADRAGEPPPGASKGASGGASTACRRVQGRLAELLDGGLDALESARDQGHLEACAACGAEREVWRELLAGVQGASRAPAAEVSWALEGLEPRLGAALAVGRRRRFRLLAGRGLVAVGTAAAAVLGLLALEAGGWGLEEVAAPTRTAELLPQVEFGLPDWADLFEPEVR